MNKFFFTLSTQKNSSLCKILIWLIEKLCARRKQLFMILNIESTSCITSCSFLKKNRNSKWKCDPIRYGQSNLNYGRMFFRTRIFLPLNSRTIWVWRSQSTRIHNNYIHLINVNSSVDFIYFHNAHIFSSVARCRKGFFYHLMLKFAFPLKYQFVRCSTMFKCLIHKRTMGKCLLLLMLWGWKRIELFGRLK